MSAVHVAVRRVYEDALPTDGARVLVDRLWPRGLSKAKAHLDEWLRSVSPSTELRQWYGHDPERFAEFSTRYEAELRQPEPAAGFAHLVALAAAGPLTLLTASKAVTISEATVLATLLQEGGDLAGIESVGTPG